MPASSPSRFRLLLILIGCVLSYHLALMAPQMAGWFVLGHTALLLALRRVKSARAAFYLGLLAGIGVMAPQLSFFLGIFKQMAVALWLLLALWPAVFVCAVHTIEKRWGHRWMAILAPVLWMGLEFCRCEVWELKFAWLSLAFPLPADLWCDAFHRIGIYGLGAAALAIAAWANKKWRWALLVIAPLSAWPLGWLKAPAPSSSGRSLEAVGIQFEMVSFQEFERSLEKALRKHPNAQLFVLPEYGLAGPPPSDLLLWCRSNQRWLMAGGTEVPKGMKASQYYNTAFTVSPDGNILHRQVKCVPIQFFSDGLPAPSQSLLELPAGKFGIAVCYDMNYIRVMDPLVKLGAEAFFIPAMDAESWGARAHELSAHLGPIRAAEYGVPLFRLASSGISEFCLANGTVAARTSFPGQGELLHAVIPLGATASTPLDRWLVWPCLFLTGGLIVALVILGTRDRFRSARRAVL